MTKRIEVDLEPFSPKTLQLMVDIRKSSDATFLEKQLASAIGELGCRFNELLLLLHHGMISISDEPPEPRQFARKPQPDEQ